MKWFQRIIELGLVAAIAAGLYFASAEGRERARLLGDYERLRKVTGDMEAADPSKLNVLAIPSAEPLRFAWRIQGPKSSRFSVDSYSGGSSSSMTTDISEEDAIVTARVRITDEGGVQLHTNFLGSAGVAGLSDQAIGRLLRGRESEVVVEQLGETIVALGPGKQVLLRLRLSDALIQDAGKVLRPEELARYPGGEIQRVEIGYTPPAAPTAASPGQGAKP